jgi:RNA recognition motif-containing protein
MSKYGEVRDVYIPPDFHTGRPRGFCFCEFFTAKGASEALDNLNGSTLDGRELSIVFAIHKRKDPNQMRPRGRGGGYDRYNNRDGGGYDRRDDYRGGYRRDDRGYDRRDDRGYDRGIFNILIYHYIINFIFYT